MLKLEDPLLNPWAKNRITHLFYPYSQGWLDKDMTADKNRYKAQFDYLATECYLAVRYSAILPCYIYQMPYHAWYAMVEGSKADVDALITNLRQHHLDQDQDKTDFAPFVTIISLDMTQQGYLIEIDSTDMFRYHRLVPMLFQHHNTAHLWTIIGNTMSERLTLQQLQEKVQDRKEWLRLYRIKYDLFS